MEAYQEELDGLDQTTVLEAFSYEERIQLKRYLLDRVSEAEKLVHLINDINAAEGRDDEQATIEQGDGVRYMSHRGGY